MAEEMSLLKLRNSSELGVRVIRLMISVNTELQECKERKN